MINSCVRYYYNSFSCLVGLLYDLKFFIDAVFFVFLRCIIVLFIELSGFCGGFEENCRLVTIN